MRADASIMEKDLREAGRAAHEAEQHGFGGVWCAETGVDVFLQAYECARQTESVRIGTAIAVALARNPMTVAYSAWNIADVSEGRFILGLGSQVKAHVERRFSMPWHKPVAQMREFVQATQAIFRSWHTGTRLEFDGEYYHHDLMDPFWAPSPHAHEIPIWVAAVGPRMMEMGGAVADGVLLHPFSTRAYLETVGYPAIDAGLSESGRDDLDISIPLFMVMGDTEVEMAEQREKVVHQVAFYASTASYRPVLDAIGYGELQPELTALSKQGRWDQLATLIDDDVLGFFAISGTPEEMPRRARAHLGPRVDRVTSYTGWPVSDPERLASILADFAEPAHELPGA